MSHLFEKRHFDAIANVLALSYNLDDAKTRVAALFRRSNPNFRDGRYWAAVRRPDPSQYKVETNELAAALALLFDGRTREECDNACFAALPRE